MPRSNEDEAWRAIVENYGERAELDPGEAVVAEPASHPQADASAEPAELSSAHGEERFVPPPPPPLPHVPPDRLLAWTGLFGAPSVLLTALVLGIGLPSLVGYLLVASFIGGFVYLVLQMPRGPHDPYDDGARL
ncbi:hypothetical protein [Nocardioides dilutus]